MKVELEVIGFISSDVPNLGTWQPENPSDVYFPLDIEIGEKGKPGGNFFEVIIATPEGIRAFGERYGRLPDRNVMIVLEYRWAAIYERITGIVASCRRESWPRSIECLQRYFHWEYEDLQPDAEDDQSNRL
jgi:hypothetical protein